MSSDKLAEKWSDYGAKHLFGRKIVHVRYMGEDEAKSHMFYSRPIVIHLDDGSLIYPSRDDEGNDGGAIFGQTKEGKDLTFPVI